jgi:MFS family permease
VILSPDDQRLFAAAQDDMRAGRWAEAVARLEVLAAREANGAAALAAPHPSALRIPASIKRNTLFLALSQALIGAGMQVPYALGPLVAVALTGSAGLAGLAISVLGLSRFLVAYPLGKFADTHGRKPGLQLGLLLGLIGTVLVGLTIIGGSYPLFLGALLVFAMGLSAIYQLRVAAVDMYPPARRGLALGWVLTGTVVGVFVTPLLVAAAQAAAGPLRLDPLALPWLLIPVVILPGMVCVALVRPDPREIAAHLEDYYPGYRPPAGRAATAASTVSVRAFLRDYPTLVAIVSNFCAYGNMSVVMVVSSLALAYHGHDLTAVSMALALHSAGMFGFSLPLGWLTDRKGRRAVMLPGGALAAVGALMVVFTAEYWTITLGSFLVGVGWSAVNVAATVLITDRTRAFERGRAIGLNDTLGAIASLSVPLIVGPMAAALGLPSTGLLAMALMIAPIGLLLALREPIPGLYAPIPASGDAA